MVAVDINVKGMHCKSCEMLVKDSLMEEEGVKDVEASFKKGNVKVNFDENRITIKKIKDIIKKEGYDA